MRKKPKISRDTVNENFRIAQSNDSDINPRFSSTIYELNSNWRNVDNLALYTTYSQHADQREFLMKSTIKEHKTGSRNNFAVIANDIAYLRNKYEKSFN